jgi:hypothetical protein
LWMCTPLILSSQHRRSLILLVHFSSFPSIYSFQSSTHSVPLFILL